jgi:hypothetical protein
LSVIPPRAQINDSHHYPAASIALEAVKAGKMSKEDFIAYVNQGFVSISRT